MSGQMGQLVDDLVTALTGAGLVASPAMWSADQISAAGADEFVLRFERGEAGGIDGNGVQADRHGLVVSCLVGGGAMTPAAKQAAALDRVSLVRRTLDVASPGSAHWTWCRFTGYALSDIDATWLVVDIGFELVATFSHSVAT